MAEEGLFARARGATRTRQLEIFGAFLMALATIGAAWASYESSRWGAVQTANFNGSNAARVESARASAAGGQQVQIDVAMFFQAADAFAAGDEELFQFYVDRARDEFKPALEAWIASEPLTNPDAALTPFRLPEYQIAKSAEADALGVESEAQLEVAKTANQRSDNYVLATVVFAAILFLAGMTAMFRSAQVKTALTVVASVGFAANSLWVATMPVVFSV
jgi:hypothetical protein